MANPLLTVLFNLFLVGSALAIVAAMIQEYLESRVPSVGSDRPGSPRSGEPDPTALRVPQRRTVRRAA
jgi:hypothetical protein